MEGVGRWARAFNVFDTCAESDTYTYIYIYIYILIYIYIYIYIRIHNIYIYVYKTYKASRFVDHRLDAAQEV